MLTLIGVTLPVALPSTLTLAPDGNEVTFRFPFSSAATMVATRSNNIRVTDFAALTTSSIDTGLVSAIWAGRDLFSR
jgi:hypothetical protein